MDSQPDPPRTAAADLPHSAAESFTVSFQPTEGELVDHYVAWRLPSPIRVISRWLLVVGGLALLAVDPLLPPGEERGFFVFLGLLTLTMGTAIILTAPYLIRRAYRRMLRANPLLLETRSLRFGAAGVALESGPSLTPWNGLPFSVSQDEEAFYLHTPGLRTPELLPRRALSPEAQDAFARWSGAPLRPTRLGGARKAAK